jgi:hypothetical protein
MFEITTAEPAPVVAMFCAFKSTVSEVPKNAEVTDETVDTVESV